MNNEELLVSILENYKEDKRPYVTKNHILHNHNINSENYNFIMNSLKERGFFKIKKPFFPDISNKNESNKLVFNVQNRLKKLTTTDLKDYPENDPNLMYFTADVYKPDEIQPVVKKRKVSLSDLSELEVNNERNKIIQKFIEKRDNSLEKSG